MALESMVGADCDQCNACVSAYPQMDTTIKNYIVNHRMIEVMSRLEQQIGDEDEPDFRPVFRGGTQLIANPKTICVV